MHRDEEANELWHAEYPHLSEGRPGLLGAVTMGFGLAGVGVVATVIVMASLFQRLKRGRPDGYYQQQFAIGLSDHGLRRSPFIRRTGAWDIGRTSALPQ